MSRREYSGFTLSKEKLKECAHLTSEQKLNWLEEANQFVKKYVSPEKIKRWQEIEKRNS